MTREEIILTLLDLNVESTKALSKRFGSTFNLDPVLTKSWYELKPERFYLVESTRHNEEDFTTHIEVRYSLRSGEARKYGEGHQAFYDRYISTSAFDIKYLENPQDYLKLIQEELSQVSNT